MYFYDNEDGKSYWKRILEHLCISINMENNNEFEKERGVGSEGWRVKAISSKL